MNQTSPIQQEIQFSNKENSGFENDGKSQSSVENRSVIEERCMLKRQILAEGLKQYNINPEWIKDEHLDQMEVE